jgi:ABC-type phosphate/phosphonate transport system substrate-binding protein
LGQAGLSEVPGTLNESVSHDAAWVHPELLLSQTCGFPYVKHLRGRVRLVATPVYAHPGCDGPLTCSFIIVSEASGFHSIEDLRGARTAINEPDSNSGTNLFRTMIAPFSRDGRFFSSVIETGSHRNSIDAVRMGTVDVAAIDCVTYGNILRFDPQSLKDVRILCETVKGPGLPLITSVDTSDAELALLRSALRQAIIAPSMVLVRDVLSLRDFAVLEDADYQPLAAFEQEARRLGYPVIA